MKPLKASIILFLGILFLSQAGYSQLIEIPIPARSSQAINSRLKTDSIPIDLPIWDDFSTSHIHPDTTFWLSANAIFVNPGVGINPPSINVATFDGWDAFGTPYSTSQEAKGKIDSLVSRPVNLGQLPASLVNTVYLSFYYQKQGNGDIPNEGDSLILQFKHQDGTWETVWPLPGEVVSTISNFFTQKILQVGQEYLYDGFQFKFQAFGRQTGPFDTWNLDYISMDKRRNINDVDYLDRTFRTVPTSIFQPYSAIPAEHFFDDPGKYLDSSAVDFINLERQVQPVEYTAITSNLLSGSPVDTLILDSAFLALRYPLGQFTLKAGYLDPQQLDQSADSILLKTTFYMDSGDDYLIDSVSNGGIDTTRYQNIDLRVNDTTSVVTVLSDYYAYDDGTAEFGAGINQLNGRIACMFVTGKTDYITSIDINFLNIGAIIAGTPIQLFVMDSLVENLPEERMTSATANVLDELNGFVTYTLSEPVEVSDTFYIGFQQLADRFIPVGLDKNTNSAGRVYLNVSGAWQQDSLVTGSLMMRPRFGEEIVTGIERVVDQDIGVYPNPTSGVLFLSHPVDQAILYDMRGIQMQVQPKGSELDLSQLPSSTYILRLRKGEHWYSRRIIVDH